MDEPSASDEFRARMLRAMERFRELNAQTKNPMYIWEALLCAAWLRQKETDYTQSDVPLTIPGWCADYVRSVAWDLSCLANGMDQAREGVAGKDYPKLSAEAAVKLVPQALGFTRQGYSAFEQMQSTTDVMGFFHRYEELREGGASSTDAIERLMEEFGMAEDRSVRRKLAVGRRLVKGERPEERDGKDQT